MNKFQSIAIISLLFLIFGVSSCQSPIPSLVGEYSYKISGQVSIGSAANQKLNDEIGVLTIIHDSDSTYILTFNALNDAVYYTTATCNGKEIVLENFQRTLSVTYSGENNSIFDNNSSTLFTNHFNVTISGSGSIYDQTIIFTLQHTGKELDSQQSIRGKDITMIAKKN